MNPFIPANPSASYVASQQEVAERLQQFDAWWDIKGSDATDFSKDWEVEKYSMPRILTLDRQPMFSLSEIQQQPVGR